MYADDSSPNEIYRGMNPKFVRQVWEKRRKLAGSLPKKRQSALREQQKLERAAKNKNWLDSNRLQFEQMCREESFQAQFLREIAELRLGAMFELYKNSPSDIKCMAARYRASEIIRIIAHQSELTVTEVLGSSRKFSIVRVRQQAMAYVYVLCPHLSLPQIGTQFGRDHTTVLHAVRKLGVWRNGPDSLSEAA